MGTSWTRRSERHEKRRQLKLQEAQRRGDTSRRAMWLLPRPLGGELASTGYHYNLPATVTRQDEVRVVIEHDASTSVYSYGISWLAPFTLARLCAPRLHTFPPVFDESLEQLCPLYIPVESPSALTPSSGLVEWLQHGRTNQTSLRRVAGERVDLDRWRNATSAYLRELGETQREVVDYWRARGRKLPLSGLKRRAFRRWQDVIRASYQRIAAASDEYRPVFDAMTGLITETGRAHDTLTAQYRLLHDWEVRRIWRLRPQRDGYLIIRTDLEGDDIDDTTSGMPIRDVYKDAREKRHRDLCVIDWDEDSIAVSDEELEALFREHREIGLTRSGRPLVHGPPVLFTTWLDHHVDRDFWGISDRVRLADDVEQRARIEAELERRMP